MPVSGFFFFRFVLKLRKGGRSFKDYLIFFFFLILPNSPWVIVSDNLGLCAEARPVDSVATLDVHQEDEQDCVLGHFTPCEGELGQLGRCLYLSPSSFTVECGWRG